MKKVQHKENMKSERKSGNKRSGIRKKCNMERVQNEESERLKACHEKNVQHEQSAK